MTQDTLAEAVGCSVQMIRKLEAGVARPSPLLADQLTQQLGRPPSTGREAPAVSFGAWLRRQRKALDLTQAALAHRAGCSLSTIKRLEQGGLRPSKALAEILARVLDLPVGDRTAWTHLARHPTGGAPTPAPPPAGHTNLPTLLLPLLGRTHELARLTTLLQQPSVRLITLTGPAGVGKTRLALHAASAVQDAFVDGVWLVSLATLTDAALLEATISQALDRHEGAEPTGVVRLRAYLRPKHLLLVLDNFEQLLAAGPVVAALLAGAPWVKLLITSRAAVQLEGEYEIPVAPLALPPQPLPPLAMLPDYAAIQLFLQRARAVNPAFHLTAETAPLVATICTQLDGVPLAIELAAARCRVLTPTQLLAGLAHPLTVLIDGSVDRPVRHQALRNALTWSYDLLQAPDQLLLASLGVFMGGVALSGLTALLPPLLAAAQLPADLPAEAVLAGLERLLAHHLVRLAPEDPREPRFTLLETVRAFARDQLQTRGLLPLAEQQHAAQYLALAEQAGMVGSPEAWLAQVDRDRANFRAALSWAVRDGRDLPTAARLALALGGFWETRGYWEEGRYWLTAILAQAPQVPVALVGRLQYYAGRLAYLQGEEAPAEAWLQASLAAGTAAADVQAQIWALNTLGRMAYSRCDYPRAHTLYTQSLALGRTAGDLAGVATALNHLGGLALVLEDLPTADVLLQESLTLRQQAGDQLGVARSLVHLGMVAQHREDYAQARQCFTASIARARSLGDKLEVSLGLNNLGWTDVAAGRPDRAQLALAEALGLAREVGSRWSAAVALCFLGWVAVERHALAQAAPLFQESLDLAQAQGIGYAVVLDRLGLAQVALGAGDPVGAAQQVQTAEALRQRLGAPYSPFERRLAERLHQAVQRATTAAPGAPG